MDQERLSDAEIAELVERSTTVRSLGFLREKDILQMFMPMEQFDRLIAELREWREIYKSGVPVGGKLHAPPFKLEDDK